MPDITLKWKPLNETRRHHTGPGEALFVGNLQWPVGVSQPHKREGSEPYNANWEVWVNLPGIKVMNKLHVTMTDGKKEVERLVTLWFKWTLEEEKPNGQREIA